MAEKNAGEVWVNREDESHGGAFRVESPGEGVFLVRADGPYRAAETLVEDFLGYSIVDEAVERCRVAPAYDVEAPGLRNIYVWPGRTEPAMDSEYRYEATHYGAAPRTKIVGFSDDSERAAVETLVASLAEFGVTGSVRVVCPPVVTEPVPLAQWRAREDREDDAGGGGFEEEKEGV